LPDADQFASISDVYCHTSQIATVEFLDCTYLRQILENDDEKLLKLWSILAYRLIIIYSEKLPQFKFISKEKVKMLVKMCTVAKYQPGDLLDLSRGGVCFRGGYKELGNETTEAQKALQQIEEEQKKLDMKFKEYMQVSEAHNNLSYLASKK
jgi:hypothetical protein